MAVSLGGIGTTIQQNPVSNPLQQSGQVAGTSNDGKEPEKSGELQRNRSGAAVESQETTQAQNEGDGTNPALESKSNEEDNLSFKSQSENIQRGSNLNILV